MTATIRRREGGRPRVLRVVTLVSSTGRYGGPSDTAERQCALLREAGLEAELLAGHLQGDRREVRYGHSVRVRSWIPGADYQALFSARLLRALWRSSKANDVVFISYAREAIPLTAALVGLILRKRVVLQPHGMLTARTGLVHSALDLLVKPIASRAHVIVALTEVEKADLERWLGRSRSRPRIDVVGNPSPRIERNRRREQADLPRVLFAGRLHTRKRVGDFAAAAMRARERDHPMRFVVAGPDQGELALVNDAIAAGAPIDYLGPLTVEQLDHEVARSAVFVLPSIREPWGNVLVTAIRAGVPVVVTESAALAPAVLEFDCGRVVPDGDPAAIEEAVWSLVQDNRLQPGPPREIEELFGDAAICRGLLRVCTGHA